MTTRIGMGRAHDDRQSGERLEWRRLGDRSLDFPSNRTGGS
ncbi:hypothetical protein [Natrarchaeobaculum aegyptiacum]|nr:hypothetical protein [Natrarchaeobaculum aegyptiacum]